MKLSVIIGCIISIRLVEKLSTKNVDPSFKRKFTMLKYKTIGILLWPLLFYAVVPKEDSESPKMTLAFIWPIVMWLWDSYLLTYGLVSENSSSKFL